jgi:hypothetical protein
MTFIKDLLDKPLYESQGMIHRELSSRAAFLIGKLKQDQNLVKGVRLMEMRDAPDQQQYPLTRREVERLLTKYERREEANPGDNPEARSMEGAKRVRWYAPEHNSDFSGDDNMDGVAMSPDQDQRPSKLMPYDYYFDVSKKTDVVPDEDDIGDSDDNKHPDGDWGGEFNKFFMESEDEAANSVVELFQDALKHGYPVEFHLDDGAYVTVDPSQSKNILDSGLAHDVLNHITSADHFQTFMNNVYGGSGDNDSDDSCMDGDGNCTMQDDAGNAVDATVVPGTDNDTSN